MLYFSHFSPHIIIFALFNPHIMKVFDDSQIKVIDADGGHILVLAPPGCGKTELLTHRILKAHEKGVDYNDMLCLTFTNRAARGMRDRIKEASPEPCEGLFVGNIHRFCSRFLYENQIIPLSTGIIDELDQQDIFDDFGFTQYNSNHKGYDNQLQVADIGRLASRLYQEEHNHPREIWLDMPKFKTEEVQRKSQDIASLYYEYKQANNILDFDDILLYSYTRMMEPDYKELQYSDYPWIQIDEVQDLNNLQFAIIDKLTARENFTVMYLGDEQQAIYSFMGAKISSLSKLVERAGGNPLRLNRNYRSPKYLLEAFNTYAISELRMDPNLLPTPNSMEEAEKGTMNIFEYSHELLQDSGLVQIVRTVTAKYPEERVGVLVRTNNAAEEISNMFSSRGIPHFKLSGQDIFKTNEFKALVAHFSVVHQDTNYFEWARVLWTMKATPSYKDARGLVTRLRDAAITPLDFIDYCGESSYVAEFLKTYKNKEFVIFDTETTGLNLFEDDIIQIAAIKVRNGEVVPGSEFNALIRTDREIPALLGKDLNPMVEVYNNGPLFKAEDALTQFLDYVGNDEVLGHNINFDYQILRYNLLRRLNGVRIENHIKVYWDSLKLIRLLEPHLRVYKLKNLLEAFGLEGQNSHRADDDILATKSLVDYCAEAIQKKLPNQAALWRDVNVRNAVTKLKENYEALYSHTRQALYSGEKSESSIQFLDEFEVVYKFLTKSSFIAGIPSFEYIVSFLRENVFSITEEPYFWDQINAHLSDIKSFSQADLCESGVIKEMVYVMTVHKAKGLEFEHVILYNAVDGTYPLFLCKTAEEKKEDARVFYVGLSRAKKRISVLYSKAFRGYQKHLTPYLDCIKERFTIYKRG